LAGARAKVRQTTNIIGMRDGRSSVVNVQD
jgi:hypothetical protein